MRSNTACCGVVPLNYCDRNERVLQECEEGISQVVLLLFPPHKPAALCQRSYLVQLHPYTVYHWFRVLRHWSLC